jgi:hypothetical protein
MREKYSEERCNNKNHALRVLPATLTWSARVFKLNELVLLI